jgi:hypothetical protein
VNRARLAKLVLWAACTAGPASALAGWRNDGVPQGGATAYGTGPATAYRGDWGAAVSNQAAGAVQTNHTGEVDVVGDFSASGAVQAGRLVSSGVYDEAGRSIPGIAVDSAVRYDAGKDWVVQGDAPASNKWAAIAWSPKLRLFVAVSASKIAYSRDGVGWASLNSPVAYATDVVWAPELGLFVVVTDNSSGVAISADGINWQTAPTPPSGNLRGVAWSAKLRLLVAVGASRIATSPDGLTWTTATSSGLWSHVCWSPELGLFAAASGGIGPRITISEDGVTWTYPTVPANYFLDVDWSPELGVFVAVGSRGGTCASVIVSPNGVNWSEVPAAPKSGWNRVCWSPEARCFVAVSYSGQVMRSRDAYNWTLQPTPVVEPWWAVEWSPTLRMFIAGGESGTMIVSAVDRDVSVGSLAVEGSVNASGDISAGGNVQLGTAYGTNTIAGDTQIGNSERLIEINQLGLAIIDVLSERTEFAVEQFGPGKWRVDLKGNALTNAGAVSAQSLALGGVSRTNWPATVLQADKAQWALDAYSPPGDFTVQTNSTGITIKDYTGAGGTVRIPPFINGQPVTVLAWGAFEDEGDVLHIEVPSSVHTLEQRAIYECDNLISADLGGTAQVIGNSLFARCYALERVTGLDSVTHIEPFGFHSSGLREAHFSSTVTNMGEWVFYNCTNLTAVYFEGDAPVTVAQGIYYQSNLVTTFYRSGSQGFGETWPSGPYARPTALFGPLTASGLDLFGQVILPDAHGALHVTGIMELVFTSGDRLFGDGANLYYVTSDGTTTNALTTNP